MTEVERVEVKLDKECRQRLRELALRRHASVSDVLRALIHEAYTEIDRERRRQAAERLCALEIEDVPDPEELTRQLESTHDLPDLY